MWRKCLRSVETCYGKCWFYGKDEYIGRSLFSYGEFSGQECEEIISLAAGGNCIDVGANIGFMSMAMAHSGCSVLAFEPQPELFKILALNTEDMDVSGSPVALSDKNGTGKMPRIRYGDRGNYGGLGLNQKSDLGTIEVPTSTLDSYDITSHGISRVDFIKIDVEGHELEVLRGATETILRDKPIMYVEDDRVEKSFALRKYIKSLGYTIRESNTPMFRSNNYFGNSHNIWHTNYISMNIVCSK
jgi:FkbM family methyltransferase